MQRFYIENFKFQNNFILDNKELVHQIGTVLRSRIGDNFSFFDGKIFIDRVYKLSGINKNALEFKLLEEIKKSEESHDLVLFQSIPNKIEKIEYIIQKGTEIGFTRFVFFRSDRSQKLSLSSQKEERLKKIIIESSEQSGRNIIPEFYNLEKMDFKVLDSKKTIFCHTDSTSSIKIGELKSIGKDVNIIVGPEGGFTSEEVEHFESLKFQRVTLGNNILRCETVAPVVGFYMMNR